MQEQQFQKGIGMPGYKGHLAGGFIAYSIALAAVLTAYPLLIAHAQHTPFCLIQYLFNSWILFKKVPTPSLLHHYQPPSAWLGLLICFEWLLCTLAGALFPDVDIKSKGQKIFYWLLAFVLIGFVWFERHELTAYLGICALTPMLVNHRGLFHRLWFILLFACVVWWGLSVCFPALQYALLCDLFFFCAGAISHLWLDMGFKRMIRLKW